MCAACGQKYLMHSHQRTIARPISRYLARVRAMEGPRNRQPACQPHAAMLGQCAKYKIKEKRPEKVNCAQRPTQKGRARKTGPKIRGTQNVPWHNTPLALYGRFLYRESCVQHTRKPTRSHAHTRATRVSPATTAASTRRARGRRVGGTRRAARASVYPPLVAPPAPPHTHISPSPSPAPHTAM